MRFQTPLVAGTLIRRYKRFLSDVELDTGETITAHCPNPGSMIGLKDPGLRVWVEPNDDPKKKLKYGWRLAELQDGALVGIDTAIPNKIVKGALLTRAIPALADYDQILPEQKYGTKSRIDFLCRADGQSDAFVEVKCVNLCRDGDWVEFPDAVTARGTKHLHELIGVRDAGHRAVMIYVNLHTGCNRLRLAEDIDPVYAAAFRGARDAGVQMICHTADVSADGITLIHEIPIFVD